MSNGLESRLVENANKVGYKFKSSDGIQTIATGDIINIDPLANTGSAPGIPFASYERIGSAFTANLAGLGFGDELNWMLVDTTPQNSPITLDSSNSSAYKHLMTIGKDSDGMAHLQVFSQEMISNGTAYDGDDNEFSQLTNGITTDDLARTITTKVSSIPLNTYFGDE